jgi:hypothetical protein
MSTTVNWISGDDIKMFGSTLGLSNQSVSVSTARLQAAILGTSKKDAEDLQNLKVHLNRSLLTVTVNGVSCATKGAFLAAIANLDQAEATDLASQVAGEGANKVGVANVDKLYVSMEVEDAIAEVARQNRLRNVRAVVQSNVASLAACSTTQDGITLVAGDTVLLVGQTTAAENGPYLVGTPTAGNAALTRPGWWKAGYSVPDGFEFIVATDATSATAMAKWKATGHGKVVGTNDPLIYPVQIKGSVALTSATPSTASVASLFIAAGAKAYLTETTNQANSTLKAVLSVGQGNGSLAITGAATNTDTIGYLIVN